MKSAVVSLVLVVLLAGACLAQSPRILDVQGPRACTVDAKGRRIESPGRYGGSIWNNFAWKWMFMPFDKDYIFLDWGSVPEAGNGLPDEVVDGFRFSYATIGTDARMADSASAR